MEAPKLLDFMLLATLKGAPAQIIKPLLQLDHPNLTWPGKATEKECPKTTINETRKMELGPNFGVGSSDVHQLQELHNFQCSPG